MRRAATVLRDAFRILEREAPVAAHRVAREIHGLTLRVEVDRETMLLRGDADRVRIVASAGPVDIDVRSDRTTILALADGQIPLMDCVLAGHLSIRGDVDLMPALSRASVAFSEGAIRSRAMRDLLEVFRHDAKAVAGSYSRSSLPKNAGRARRASN
jgi:hypothetical protein